MRETHYTAVKTVRDIENEKKEGSVKNGLIDSPRCSHRSTVAEDLYLEQGKRVLVVDLSPPSSSGGSLRETVPLGVINKNISVRLELSNGGTGFCTGARQRAEIVFNASNQRDPHRNSEYMTTPKGIQWPYLQSDYNSIKSPLNMLVTS